MLPCVHEGYMLLEPFHTLEQRIELVLEALERVVGHAELPGNDR